MVGVPVIGSLNGNDTRRLAGLRQIQEAGADALEINFYHVATDPKETGADVERRLIDVVRLVEAAVTIPVAVKGASARSAPPRA